MKVIKFHFYCDNGKDAGHPSQTVEGDTVLVYSPKQEKVVELDFCAPCLGVLTLPALTYFADTIGREIATSDIDTDLVCPFGCRDSRPYKDKGGKARHMTRKHPDWAAEQAG